MKNIFQRVNTHQQWYAQINTTKRRLQLTPNTHLTEQELMLLHLYLRGFPHKIIARNIHRSVKTVEKRLARIKEQLAHPNCHCYSLHGCLEYHDLFDFILASANWFAEKDIREAPTSHIREISYTDMADEKPAR